jgi:hypothetical protein
MAPIDVNEYLDPYPGSGRWLRGNLHAHTCCGHPMDVTVSGPMYASLGYHFLAITDHNQALSKAHWQIWQQKLNIILIPGEENGDTDHIVELGVHQVTSTPESSYAKRARALGEAGGFIIGAHPQEYADGSDKIRSAVMHLHAFELFNGLREARGCDERANLRLWDELLTDGERIWGVAVDDFHCEHITPGHGWVWVEVPQNTPTISWETIVEGLIAGAFYASTYPRLDKIGLQDGSLHVTAGRYTQRLRVVGPGGRTLYALASTELEWRPPPDLEFFRVEAECGTKRAWSQPFFHV